MKNSFKFNGVATAFGCVACLFALAGCSPDEMEVSISAKDLAAVRAGAVAYADVSVSFANEQESIKEKMPQIRETVKPYLGETGKFTVRGGKLTANFRAPVVSGGTACAGEDRAVARLVLGSGRLQLFETPYLKALNSDLSAIDFSIDVDLKAKHMVYKIVGGESAKCEVRATAVFVDGDAHVNFSKRLGAGDSVDIEFRCDTDASIWHQIRPQIEIR